MKWLAGILINSPILITSRTSAAAKRCLRRVERHLAAFTKDDFRRPNMTSSSLGSTFGSDSAVAGNRNRSHSIASDHEKRASYCHFLGCFCLFSAARSIGRRGKSFCSKRLSKRARRMVGTKTSNSKFFLASKIERPCSSSSSLHIPVLLLRTLRGLSRISLARRPH